jgi:DNA repair protein RadC
MASASPGALMTVIGIGPVCAGQVVASFELARRWPAESLPHRPVMSDPANIIAVFVPQLRDLAVEEVHVGVLDTEYRLEREIRVTTGILDLVAIHPREVFRLVLGAPAAAIILVHNHPGGDPTPSPEERQITEGFAAAGHMLKIYLLDHVIIGYDRYVQLSTGRVAVTPPLFWPVYPGTVVDQPWTVGCQPSILYAYAHPRLKAYASA